MKKLQENFINKSEIIRTVYTAVPYASNKQIREIIKERYGVECSSTHIIAAIGKWKTRRELGNEAGLIDVAKEFLRKFTNDIDHCFYWLHQANKTI